MKILFYSPYPLDNPSMPIMLDYALDLLQDNSNYVLFLTCDGIIKRCDINYEGSILRCAECRLSKNLLTSRLNHKNFQHQVISKYLSESAIERIKSHRFDLTSTETIKKANYRGINLGLGVLSSYMSLTRNLEPKLEGVLCSYMDSMLKSSALLSEAILEAVESFQPDIICLFNGRYGGVRPVFEIGINKKIKTEVLECTYGNDLGILRKVKFDNALPHDIDNSTIVIENNWQATSNSKQGIKNAVQFFKRRKISETASDKVYTGNQIKGLLPASWDASKRNFIIFNSSEDEFFCVGESFDKYKLFDNQINGIKFLVEQTADIQNVHLYLRIHPNLKNINYKYHRTLMECFNNYKHITVIKADSPISTYKLIDECEKVFVFGSTAGVEAAYWKKPVILMGGSFYMHLGVAYYPKSMSELNDLIIKTLPCKPRVGTLKYAAFLYGERGDRPKHMNFDRVPLMVANKTLFIPRCYELFGSMIPYFILLSFFRLINIYSHLRFKLFTLPSLMIEKH